MHLFLALSVFLICYGIATPLYQLIISRNEDHHHGVANINCVLPFSLFVISGCARVREKQGDLHLVASASKIHEIV